MLDVDDITSLFCQHELDEMVESDRDTQILMVGVWIYTAWTVYKEFV